MTRFFEKFLKVGLMKIFEASTFFVKSIFREKWEGGGEVDMDAKKSKC